MVVEEEEKKNTYMRHFSVSCLKQEMEHQSVWLKSNECF